MGSKISSMFNDALALGLDKIVSNVYILQVMSLQKFLSAAEWKKESLRWESLVSDYDGVDLENLAVSISNMISELFYSVYWWAAKEKSGNIFYFGIPKSSLTPEAHQRHLLPLCTY